jgi:hypothetical protein
MSGNETYPFFFAEAAFAKTSSRTRPGAPRPDLGQRRLPQPRRRCGHRRARDWNENGSDEHGEDIDGNGVCDAMQATATPSAKTTATTRLELRRGVLARAVCSPSYDGRPH